jgi:polyhydroxyalkanoate synthesis regulator phasin
MAMSTALTILKKALSSGLTLLSQKNYRKCILLRNNVVINLLHNTIKGNYFNKGENTMIARFTKNLVCSLIIGCLSLSFGASALAHDIQNDPRPSVSDANFPNPENREKYINDSLNELVNKGTLTQEQAGKLISYFKEKDRQRRSDMDKLKAMSPEKRDAYHQQMLHKNPDILQELKDIADLSDDQAKIVADMVRPPHRLGPEDAPCCHMISKTFR